MTISKRSLLTAITMTLICTSLVIISTSAQARIKCWRNNDGIRECGENVPPEYSQQGYEKINSQGITVGREERALTKEEILEQERVTAKKAEEAAKKAKEAIKNEILLDTYSNVDDIQMAGDGKIVVINSEIALVSMRNKKIQINLDKYMAAAKSADEEAKKNLIDNIVKLKKQIKNNNKFIAEKRLKQEEIKKEYAEKIERFEKLQKNK